jgi:nucleoside-diphosphate-sugar epimerase
MRVLLTGASSFTGAWFALALVRAGAEVIAACRGPLADGDAERCRHLATLAGRCGLVGSCPFGSAPFLALIRSIGPIDILCHHGTKAGDHRSHDLDPLAATAAQGANVEAVLEALDQAGCRTLLLTGTVFEADEGRGEAPLRAFSAYGLAKSLTWQLFRYHAERAGLTLGKLVVASPFGPREKPGLTRQLTDAWLRGETPVLRRPQLVRDHLQVPLLAAAYARFALSLPGRPGTHRLVPSQFPERLDRFADRLATALSPRLALPCRFESAEPPEATDEPLARCGVEPMAALVPNLDPERAWDEYADFLASNRG